MPLDNPYVGWDVIVTADGFVVLEGNRYSDVNLLQVHRPLLVDERTRAFFRKYGSGVMEMINAERERGNSRLRFLRRIAAWAHRSALPVGPVTGSVGKCTTKNLIADVLEKHVRGEADVAERHIPSVYPPLYWVCQTDTHLRGLGGGFR